MRKIFLCMFTIFLSFSFFSKPLSEIKKLENNDFKIILSSQNMKEEKNEFLDINTASEIEMLNRKISSSYVEKILNYRDITGGFEKLEHLKRIKGIANATYLKLSKKLKVLSPPIIKNLEVNSANEKELKYFGFDKKERIKLRKYIDKNGKIASNIEFKKIINKSTYEKLKNNINYN